jgi:hypothetical protein
MTSEAMLAIQWMLVDTAIEIKAARAMTDDTLGSAFGILILPSSQRLTSKDISMIHVFSTCHHKTSATTGKEVRRPSSSTGYWEVFESLESIQRS